MLNMPALVGLAVGCRKQKQAKINLDATEALYNSEWLESLEANIGVFKSRLINK